MLTGILIIQTSFVLVQFLLYFDHSNFSIRVNSKLVISCSVYLPSKISFWRMSITRPESLSRLYSTMDLFLLICFFNYKNSSSILSNLGSMLFKTFCKDLLWLCFNWFIYCSIFSSY